MMSRGLASGAPPYHDPGGLGHYQQGSKGGLGAFDATLSSLKEDQLCNYGHPAGTPVSLGTRSTSATSSGAQEISGRRRDSIKAAFRRVDTSGQGWVRGQDLSHAMSTYSNLSSADQQRVVQGVAGGAGNEQPVPLAKFVAYYVALGRRFERDRDFEDMMRQHWGFPEVSDILDDMKNKFAMVGAAYAFRRTLEAAGGCSPELGLEAFQSAMAGVGMIYNSQDLRRVFDAFAGHGELGSSDKIELLRLTGHLTSAPRPQTPTGDSRSQSCGFGSSDAGISNVSSQQLASSGSRRGPESSANTYPSAAPAEGGPPLDTENDPRVHPSPAPPEEDDDEGGLMAPAEPDAEGHLPMEPPSEAPEEDPEPTDAPEEPATRDLNLDDEPPEPPAEQQQQQQQQGYGAYGAAPMGMASYHDNAAGYNNYHAGGGGLPSAGMPQSLAPGVGMMPPGGGPSQEHPAAAAGSHHPTAAAAMASSPGKRKAVTIGCNYLGMHCQLSGCIPDSDTFISLLTEDFGFDVRDIRQLRDDHPQRMPTRQNMMAVLSWLVSGAEDGDHLFFHYSGHGSQQNDTSGDEMDGKDETIVPVDYQQNGMISDDELRKLLVLTLPKGVRLTVVLDCCHSGTGMDLPYKVKLSSDGQTIDVKKKLPHQMPQLSEADVVMISGCKDNQTSADIGGGGGQHAAGAMTTAFKTVITRNFGASYHTVLVQMRQFLKQHGFKQLPQLSSEHSLNLTEEFMPEATKPEEPVPTSLRPPARRALTIGINYLCLQPGHGQLSGCINDSDTMIGILKDTFGFQDSQICRLRDDRPDMMPTKANMMQSFQWLVQGAGPGDEMFLHYSGHGGRQTDRDGDEVSGKDDTLIPCDFQHHGQITDDVLYETLVRNLPKGSRLWVVLDCCHSGTALDLRFKVNLSPDGRSASVRKVGRRKGPEPTQAEVVMVSGCKDTQTSADVGAGSMGMSKASGAMTTAFQHCLTPTISCEDLIQRMRQFLSRNNFKQTPQMSSEQFVNLDAPFVQYQAKRRGAKTIPNCPSPKAPFPVGNAGGLGLDLLLASSMSPLASAAPAPVATQAPVGPMAMYGTPTGGMAGHLAQMSHAAQMSMGPMSMQAPVSPAAVHMHGHPFGGMPAMPMTMPAGAHLGGAPGGHMDARIMRLQDEIARLRSTSPGPGQRPPDFGSLGQSPLSPGGGHGHRLG